jgi:hypothetical protein
MDNHILKYSFAVKKYFFFQNNAILNCEGNKMRKDSYAVKLNPVVLSELKDFCERKGYKQSAFVERALQEQIEREELKDDIFDLVTLRSQEQFARPLKEYERHRE